MTEKYTRWVARSVDLQGQGYPFRLNLMFRVPREADKAEYFATWYKGHCKQDLPIEFCMEAMQDIVYYPGTHMDYEKHHVVVLTCENYQLLFIESDVYTA